MFSNDPIVIVGYSHRLPGEERGDFWDLLLRGEDLVTEVAADRWAKETYQHPNKSEPGKAYTFASGSVGDIFGFDAAFFGISPREAAQMDPQQRLLLELTWEAFEKAGIKPSLWRGSDAGVFVGISTTDNVYSSVDDLAKIESTSATGNTNSIAANRLSYFFDLRGASMSVDTACSSSLVAFHQACQAIRCGDSGAAIVAGISLHLHPMGFINFSKTSMLSPEGRCTPFDEGGKGYARSEGAGVILLKRLSKAVENGDEILAVVAASAVNCDGKTSSLTVPSAEAQARLLEDVYQKADIHPDEISYIEAHGTGTQVGDPIETSALAEVLGKRRRAGSPLPIGSVKSNIGHLEAASGIAGLVKALLVLKHRIIPPTIHLKKVNPKIPLEDWGLAVPVEPTSLPAKGRLVVGVNSFGFGGANAHVVLESPASKKASGGSKAKRSNGSLESAPLFLSAKSEEALRDLAQEYSGFLRKNTDVSIYEVAHAVTHRREWLSHRLAVTGETALTMAGALDNWLQQGSDVSVVEGRELESSSGVVFVFSGNGSQYAGMGRQLLSESPAFRDAVAEVDALFSQYADYSILEVLKDPEKESMLRLTEVAQPALFAIQVGLVRLMKGYGITPSAVIGHSVGEVAAAWTSGALSLEQAVHVIHERSLQQGKTKGLGGMTAVALGSGDLGEILQRIDPRIRPALAGINSPRSCTLAGAREGLDLCEEILVDQGVRFKRLDLDYAFHSPAMDPIRKPLLDDLADLTPLSGEIPFHSTVTGERISGCELGPDYWWRNVRDPVLFAEAMEGLIGEGARTFIEVGPHPVLRTYVKECLQQATAEGLLATTMTRAAGNFAHFLRAILEVVQTGTSAGRGIFFERPISGRVSLPGYPWQKVRFETPQTGEAYCLSKRVREHPLLGYRLKEGRFTWENYLDTSLYPFLSDHKVGGVVVFPAAGFVELALAAGSLRFGSPVLDLEDLEIHAPLLLEEKKSKTIRVILDEHDSRLSVMSRDRLSVEPWMTHATVRVLPSATQEALSSGRVNDAGAPSEVALTGEELYQSAARLGLEYGDAFRYVCEIRIAGHGIRGSLKTPDCLLGEQERYLVHPCYLDGALQALLGLLATDPSESHGRIAYLPVRFDRFRIHRPHESCASLEATIRHRTRRGILADLSLRNSKGELVATASGVRFKAAKLIVRAGDHARLLSTTYLSKPLSDGTANKALALQKLGPLLKGAFARLEDSALWQRYAAEVEPLLELLCSEFVREAFVIMTGGSTRFTLDQLVTKGTVSASLQPYAASLLWMLEQDGLLIRREEGYYSWVNRPEEPSARAVWLTLIESHTEYSEVIRAAGRIGSHLVEILSGQRDALGLLPRHWSEESPLLVSGSLAELHDLMVRALGETIPMLGAGGRPRILWMMGRRIHGERIIGPWMSWEHCEVVVTVPNQQARRDLMARLEGQAGVFVHTLEEGEEVPAADSLGGRFDFLMVAGGVTDLASEENLAALNKLLLPGGTLAFAEKAPNRIDDFLFGSNRCWWQSDDDGRLLSRLKRPDAWKLDLEKKSFTDVCAVSPKTTQGSSFLMLASTAPAVEKPASVPESSSWVLLFDDEPSASLALLLQGHLESLGQKSVIAPSLEPASWNKLLSERVAACRGVVCISGLRKSERDVDALLADLKGRILSLNELLKVNEGLPSPLPVTVVSSGLFHEDGAVGTSFSATPEGGALLGYLRVAGNEYASANLRLLDVRHDSADTMAQAILAELIGCSGENEVVLGSFGRKVPRVRAHSSAESSPNPHEARYLDFTQPGSFTNLKWHSRQRTVPGEGELEIEVKAAGLNFRDVMYAMGLLPDEALESGFAGQTVGMELSGVVTRTGKGVTGIRTGDEVIAFAPRAFATHAVTRMEAVMKKPADWSFESAATISTAFFTVYYALVELARVRPGERILIHGAAGGVGIAAIQLARHLGLEIFATAGSEEKRDFVRMLGVDHVLDSRSMRFADEILALTAGGGVDVVLNSLAGEAVVKNLRILRPFGRFLELGKRDFYENSRIGLRPFRNNITYYGIDADQLMAANPVLTGELFAKITALFNEGILHPLPHIVFDSSEIAEAFRHMQHSKQVGKVVVTSPGAAVSGVVSTAAPRRLSLRADATYLVTGGTSGFGLRTAEWMAARGARFLVLASRRGVLTDEGRAIVASLKALGVTVEIVSCDVGSRDSVSALLERIRSKMPPLRGVVHSAMVIDDGLLKNLSEAQLEKVLRPKIAGAMLLDELTRNDRLDLFVLYSSATTVFGNPGQGAYVAANLALEALASIRASVGLPSTCAAWGPIDDAGYLARNQQIKEALGSRMGGRAITSEEALETLESLILREVVNSAWLDLEWGKLSKFLPSAGAPRFDCFRHESEDQSAQGGEVRSIREQFAGLNHDQAVALLKEHLVQSIATILRMDHAKLDHRKSLFDAGMDSLMAVELAATLEESLEIKLPMMALSEGPTIQKLAEKIAGMIGGETQDGVESSPVDTVQESLRALAAQHGAGELTESDLAELASSLSHSSAQA
jgi:acyl transferase domain-containing protein/NADPH:quinone reductase-like Zn-dependent oxidoreductase/acyl carrier protein